MANLANLNVGIGANLTGLQQGLKRASKQLTSFSQGIESKLGRVSLGGLDQKIRGIGSSSIQAVPSANKLQKSLGGVSKQGRKTTSAVVNFNRVIQDAPFGIIGVANNLEPLITSFQGLGDESSTTGDKLQLLLKKSFTGPGALITIVSIASSALLFFSQRMRGAGDSSEEASKQLEAFADAGKNLNDVLSQDTGYANQIAEEIRRNKQAIQIAEERQKIEQRLADAQINIGGNVTQAQKELRKELEDQIQARNELIGVLGFENTELESLSDELTVLQKKQELYNGTVGTSETQIAAFADAVQGRAQKAINQYEAGLDGSADSVRDQITEVRNLITSFRQLANNGQTELVPVINLLQDTLKDLSEIITDTGEDAPKAIDPIAEGFNYTGRRVDEARKKVDQLSVSIQNMPSVDEQISEEDPAEGSIAQMQKQVGILRSAMERVRVGSESFRVLQQMVNDAESELEGLNQTASRTGDIGAFVGRRLGQAFAQATIFADDLGESIRNIGKQLASKAITDFFLSVFTGSPTGFFGEDAIFGGVFHSGGVVPGNMTQERLVLAKGGETIRTPSQESTFRSGGTIHVTGEFVQRGSDLVAVINQTNQGTLR